MVQFDIVGIIVKFLTNKQRMCEPWQQMSFKWQVVLVLSKIYFYNGNVFTFLEDQIHKTTIEDALIVVFFLQSTRTFTEMLHHTERLYRASIQ